MRSLHGVSVTFDPPFSPSRYRGSIATRELANNFARHQQLHYLRGTIADFESDHVPHSLLMGQIKTEAEMAVEQQAMV